MTGWKTVEDPDLAQWLSAGGEEVRELIVEADTPPRKVSFQRQPDGRMLPADIQSPGPAERAAVLEELSAFLIDQLDLPTRLLRSADAVVVKANSRQVARFVDHPLVKAIRPNRRLG